MHKPITAALQPAQVTLSDKRVHSKTAVKTTWGFVKSHTRRLFVEALNVFFNHDWIFWLIGLANKKLGLIESVFLVYPANDEYGLAYAYRKRLRRNEWIPWLVGFFWQNGKIGIKFAISAHNGQFRDPANKEKLRDVVNRMEKIKNLFQAKRKTFAGILPGVLFSLRMLREMHEAKVTVKVVLKAIERVKALEGLARDTPIIVLGGRGFIGRKVVAALPKGNVYGVDIVGDEGGNWPIFLLGKPALLVNISLNSVLTDYLGLLWPGVVVINEVYPEPSLETASRLRDIGCPCYHIVGVEGGAFPSFPRGYQGGIPCCAAWPSNGIEALLFKVA